MRTFRSIRLLVLLLTAGMALSRPCGAVPDRGDDLAPATGFWTPGKGASSPRAEPDGLRFNLPFASKNADRFTWDQIGARDLSSLQTLRLDVSCGKPDALRSLTLYLQSGKGWYVAAQPLRAAGRQTLLFHRGDFSTEGTPAGWNRISRIRLSPWRGVPADTSLVLHRLSAGRESIALVQGDASLPNDAERKLAETTTACVGRWLADAGIPHTRMTDRDLARGGLRGVSVALLCATGQLPDSGLAAVREHLGAGGKLIVLYSTDTRLAETMGFELGKFRKAEVPMQWASFSFTDTLGGTLPARVYQEAPALVPAQPATRDARVIAWWESASGRRTQEPAWLASNRGYWMTSLPRQGDGLSKQNLLAALLADFEPDLWPDIVRSAMQRGSRIDSFDNYADSLRALRAVPESGVQRSLDRAEETYEAMRAAARQGRYGQALHLSRALRDALTEAYARAQKPLRSPLAGVWDHDGIGWVPGDWNASMRLLKQNGMTAIFPNLVWAGLAHYPSDVLPRSKTVRLFGDQLEQACEAGRRHGIEVHVWAILWNPGVAPAEYLERARREKRLLYNAQGKEMPWLDPAHPANRAEMLAALREVAVRQPIDGLHLDYVRYPEGALYGSTTRKDFEKSLGQSVSRWPADVLPGGRHRETFEIWRCEVITSFVREVRRMLRQTRPTARLSAAVFGGYPACRKSVGQDWMPWLSQDLVDFVVPMNYTENLNRFTSLLGGQLQGRGAAGRIVPGIGVEATESSLAADQVIEQIAAARTLGVNRFVLFDLNPGLRDRILPALHLGLTRDPAAP
jgi:uncharacterized lipoprotein YddW (UPF0748 family)